MAINSIKNNSGFTLIETLVAVGLFSIVMTIGISTLMSILAANSKAQNIKTVVNNLNFSLETISSALMTAVIYPGYPIACLNNDGQKVPCSISGNSGISFVRKTSKGNILYSVYFDKKDLVIQTGLFNSVENKYNLNSPSVLVPSDITIKNGDKIFYVSKGSANIWRVEIILDGVIGSSLRGTQTSFNIQTGVTKLGR